MTLNWTSVEEAQFCKQSINVLFYQTEAACPFWLREGTPGEAAMQCATFAIAPKGKGRLIPEPVAHSPCFGKFSQGCPLEGNSGVGGITPLFNMIGLLMGESVCILLFLLYLCCCLVAKLCPTLCDPMDCSPPGSSVHGTFQGRILEWVAISSSRVSSQTRDQS